MVRTTTPGGIRYGGTLRAAKPKGLLGQWIYSWMMQSCHLYVAVCYGLGNFSSAFWNCHGVSSKVGWFPNPHTHSNE